MYSLTGTILFCENLHDIMAECDMLDVLKSEEIIAKVTKFLQEGCGCSRGMKGG